MNKRYIVTEDTKYNNSGGCTSGCGCIPILIILIAVLIPFVPYLFYFSLPLLIILGIIYIPKIQKRRQQKKEVNDLMEREQKLNIELRKRDIEKREQKLKESKNRDWSDF